jgi:hypothetical protein
VALADTAVATRTKATKTIFISTFSLVVRKIG